MHHFRQSFVALFERLRVTPIRALLFGNVLAALSLIVLSNIQVLPLRFWDFIFFSVLFFLIALYRSGFVFALLIGMLPLETVDLAPVEWGIHIRPYQFLAILLFGAILVRFAMQRIKWPFFSVTFFDIVLWVFLLIPCLMLPFLPSEFASIALKQGIILGSFGLLYFLGRVFLKKESDIRIALLFFLSSIFVILCYSFWQGIRFKVGLPSFEVMSGRPNGTLPEADFLGGLLALIISGMIPFGLSFFFRGAVSMAKKIVFALFLFSLSLILILSVARSGWLGLTIGMMVGTILSLFHHGVLKALRNLDMGFFWKIVFGKLFVGVPILVAFFVVIVFHLTAFDVFDRGKSVSSGLQKITVSCDRSDVVLPEILSPLDELTRSGCRHILLEEREKEVASGHIVREVYRLDPNISTRKHIYAESWKLIREYPITGIGFGNVSHFLGTDGNGRGLNASNVFLEVWIGTGLLGFIVFLVFWFSFPIAFLWRILRASDERSTVMEISLLSAWVATTVFNLFNSGLLLGSLWVFFAVLVWSVTSFGSKASKSEGRSLEKLSF